MNTSDRKTAANRQNAQRSTGPRTSKGKARSNQNAWRHGLATMTEFSAEQSAQIRELANAIAGPSADQFRLHFATMAAEAQLRLFHVQSMRMSLLRLAWRNAPTASESDLSADALAAVLANISRVEGYEHRAFVRRNRLFRLL